MPTPGSSGSTPAAARALPGVRAVLTAADIPELKKKAPTARARGARDRSRGLRRPAGGRRGRRRAGDRRGGPRPDRRQVRGAAGRHRPAPVHAARRPAGRGRRAPRRTRARRSRTPGSAAAKGEAGPPKAVNIAQQSHLHRGDVAKGFAESDLVLEQTYRVPMVHQGYLEPHAVLAQWDTQRAPHDLGQHPGIVQHALGGGRRPRDPGEPDPGDPDGVRRRLRRQDPRAVRAHHGDPGPRHRPAGPLRDDPARGARGGHARARRSSSGSRRG